MTGEIKVAFNSDTGETQVSAAMDTQEMKNFSISVLLTAIKLIMAYKASPIIKPGVVPPGNGKLPIPMKLSN